MKSRSIFTLAFCFWLCFTTQSPLFGQTLATVGTDFWLGYMHNTGSSSEELRLFITSQTATTGTVSIPLQGWSVNFTVAPNVTTTVVVPLGMGETITHDQVDTRGIHVTTADSASLFAINFAVFSADASKILPSSSLGTEYVVSAYPGILSFSRSEFLIVATADNTEIEITPSVTTQGGHAAGVTYTINLNEGETYQVRASSTVDDLTGTKLVGTAQSGDCRPFAVFGGAQCTNVPSGCTTCDHLYDQLFPVYAWGTEYYVSPFQSTGVYTYRILAKENGTQVSIDGGAPQTLNAGQVLEFNNVAVPRQVVSTLPVQVIQLMQGDNCSLNGDPAMLALNANDQRISNVTFSTVSSAVITNHFLNLIVESANIGSVLLDNVPIPASNFSAFPTNPANAYAQIPVSQGSHSVYAANGFTGYAYGMGTAESYAYSLGSYKGQVEIPVDSVICTSTPVTLTTPLNLFSPVWTALSDTSVVLGTSSNLNLTAPIATDVYVANGVSPLSGCPVSYSYSVSQTFSPQLLIEASEDTVCMFNPITMHVDVLDPGYFEYTWWPSYSFSNSANDTTVLIPSASGWYGVTVMNNGGGCAEASDSIYITVDGSSIESATVSASQNIVCWPDTIQLEALVNEILLYDEFSTGVGSTFWNTVSGANVATTCGAVSGDALFFNGAPARVLESVDFDVSLGGNLSFYLLVADGSAPCDDAEFGENIVLEYSTNGGSTWTPWTTLFEFNYPTATLVSIALPPTAQTGATRFRWSQPVFTGVNQDVWWLDNVLLSGSGSGSGLLYNWSPSAFVGNSGAASTQAFPDVPTWYTLVVGTGSCSYTDSVFVDVTLPISLTLNQDTIVCGSQAIQLEAMTSGTGNLTYTWGPPNVYSSINGASATVLPNLDTLCYVTVESGNGCFTQSDTVSVAFVDLSLSLQGNTTVCLGEQTTLSATVLGSANPTMAWYDGNANLVSSQANVTVSPTVNTTYYFETFDAQSGCSLHDS